MAGADVGAQPVDQVGYEPPVLAEGSLVQLSHREVVVRLLQAVVDVPWWSHRAAAAAAACPSAWASPGVTVGSR